MDANTIRADQPRLRADLVIRPDAESASGRVVKDPSARRFYRFGELESLILERLDGQRTPVEILVEVSAARGEELSLEEIQEFIDGLREKGLVEDDAPLLPVQAPELGRRVVALLEGREFRLRRADEPLPPGARPVARNMREAQQFDAAVEALRAGRFAAALRLFEEILAENPGNLRTRAIRDLLLRAARERPRPERPQQRRRGSLLFLRFPLFDPDRLLTRLEPVLRPFWTSAALAAYMALVALATWVGLGHRPELMQRIPDLSLAGWSIGILATAAVLTTMHELAHGLTCKHFGGKVPEAGFLLILLFVPAFYVDVSDAWLFRRRRERVLVSLAGPMSDLGAAAVALILWRVLQPGPLASSCMFVAAASSASALLNLNPLLRLDAYYLLSDLSGIPNLRREAFRALRGKEGEDAQCDTARKRRFLLLYGALAFVYIVLMMYLILGFVARMAVDAAGAVGLVLVVGAAGMLLRKPLRALATGLARSLRGLTGPRGIRLALGAGLLAAVAFAPWPLRVSGPASVDSLRRRGLRPEVSGALVEVLVREGDRVAAGQILARLDTRDLSADLEMTRAEIERAQADLALLIGGPEPETIRQAQERVRASQAEVAHMESRHDRLTRLRAEGLVPEDLYEQVGKELAIRRGEHRVNSEELQLLRKGTRPERIAAARAEVERLETKAADIERRLGALELKAPIAGIVVTPDLQPRLGESIPAGGLLLEIAETSALRTEILVPENEIGVVERGQEASLRLAAYPDRKFRGRIEEIAPVAETDELGRAVFRVTCSVSNDGEMLKPGMTASAKISCGSSTIGRIILRRALRLIDPSLL